MDHHNYGRCLSVYFLTLLNLSCTHTGADNLLRNCGFSVSRSNTPASRNPVDLTIEQTVKRHAKPRGGIIGFSRKYPAYFRWRTTRHARADYVETKLEMAGMTCSEDTAHKDLRPSEIRRGEEYLQTLITAFHNFINPFEVEVNKDLFCISSGARAPDEIANDILNAEAVGKAAFKSFTQKKLVAKTLNIVEILSAQRNLFGQLLILSEDSNLSLQKVLQYPLGPVPWALATPDGLPIKTVETKLMHQIEYDAALVHHPCIDDLDAYVVDGNALLLALTALPPTFGELSDKMFSVMPKVKRVDIVTDTYKENSIKSAERRRQGTSDACLVIGPSTKLPKEWKSFLSNNVNNIHLIRLPLSEWQTAKYAAQLQGRQIFVCGTAVSHWHQLMASQ